MKQVSIFLLLVMLLVACSPQLKIESTPIPSSTLIPTQTQTLIPHPTNTLAPAPTITFTPTTTLEPSLITFDIGAGVPPNEVQDIKTGLERARLYLRDFADGDISSEIQKTIVVKIVANGENRTSAFDESGVAPWFIKPWFDVKGIEWARVGQYRTPFKSLQDEHLKAAVHEYIHGWQGSLGCISYNYNLLGWWMSEGIAEWIANQTVFQYNLVEGDTMTEFMLISANATGESAFTLQSLENTESPVESPGHIGYLAIDYLMTITQADPVALRVVCEQAGDGIPVSTAFKNAFGISRQDFYKKFEEYIHGIYILTPQPSIDTGISGKVIWNASYPGDDLTKYILNFCPARGDDCFGGTKIKSDGTFFQPMFPGDYFISLNNIQATFTGGETTGWYSANGMVAENICGNIVHVSDHEITNIDFMVASPIPCRPATQTLPPDTGISGKIIWDASYPNKGLDQYMLNFCPITNENCLGATPIQTDGSFFQPLASGYYYISLNYKNGGPIIGWYLSTDMVESNSCGGLVQVVDNQITNIVFKVNSPIRCR